MCIRAACSLSLWVWVCECVCVCCVGLCVFVSGWVGACVRVRSTTPPAPQRTQTQTVSPLGVQSPGERLGVKAEPSEGVGVWIVCVCGWVSGWVGVLVGG